MAAYNKNALHFADRNAFINNADLTEETSLTHLLDVIAPDIENETQLIDHSKYYDHKGFTDVLNIPITS